MVLQCCAFTTCEQRVISVTGYASSKNVFVVVVVVVEGQVLYNSQAGVNAAY